MHRCPRLGSPHHCPSGCLGMQAQRQTSTHAGNIPSSYGNPCKLNPCPNVCYSHVLTKVQGKETWALPEILPRRLTTIWQRTAIGKTSFQTNAQELSTPTCPPQTTPEQHKECVNQKNTVSHNSCPKFYPATLEENPKNNHDLIRPLFWKTCTGKKCINS